MDVKLPQTIEHVKVSALREYERNARTHSANQIKQIVEAVRTFGWTNPLLIDDDNLIKSIVSAMPSPQRPAHASGNAENHAPAKALFGKRFPATSALDDYSATRR
jgi:hypothetical protein